MHYFLVNMMNCSTSVSHLSFFALMETILKVAVNLSYMPSNTAVNPDLKETLALSDHVCQALGGCQVLTQVFLIGAARGVLPLDRPYGREMIQNMETINYVSIYIEGKKNVLVGVKAIYITIFK